MNRFLPSKEQCIQRGQPLAAPRSGVLRRHLVRREIAQNKFVEVVDDEAMHSHHARNELEHEQFMIVAQ